MTTIMDRIKAIMQTKGITKADLVRLSGLKKPTVYRIFDEKIDGSKIRIETLAPIAKALDVELNFLLGKEDASIPPSLLKASKDIYENSKGMREQLEKTIKIVEKLSTLNSEQIKQMELFINMFNNESNKKDTDN